MNQGRILAAILGLVTVALVVVGTLWPVPSAVAYAGGHTLRPSFSTPEAAVENIGIDLRNQEWEAAYQSLANKAQLTEPAFVRDIRGSYPNLITYATLDSYEVFPLHATANEAVVQLKLHWATVVGTSETVRNVQVVKSGDRWEPVWPILKEVPLPPQVIPVNYLRWDVIYRGARDDWGAQDVEAPHVRIVDMHPVERADGVDILGELLNEDVVPAYVSVSATLMSKSQSLIATEGTFDRISHLLLPKQVTPFLIRFPDAHLSEVGSIRMTPLSTLIAASADPVIAIDNQQIHPSPDASLTGELANQSGQIVNVAHVITAFYDASGQVVWVADQYIHHALLPQIPVPFQIRIPQDISKHVSSQRSVVATYSFGGAQ